MAEITVQWYEKRNFFYFILFLNGALTYIYLKKLQNYHLKLFLFPPQNRRKHNQHFKLYFTLW